MWEDDSLAHNTGIDSLNSAAFQFVLFWTIFFLQSLFNFIFIFSGILKYLYPTFQRKVRYASSLETLSHTPIVQVSLAF